MKKFLIFPMVLFLTTAAIPGHAQSMGQYTVVPGDSMWKIAVRHEVGLHEIKSANPQISNPNLIYPGQVLYIPKTDATVTSYENEVIRLVNENRVNHGLKDMKDNSYFSHTSPVYGSPFDMIRNFGISYRSAGENIAKGQTTPQAVVDAWMNSAGHRANILNPAYTKIGVGYVAGGNYWTQMFIGQ